MTKRQAIRLILLWLATLGMGAIVGVLLFVQMTVSENNVITEVEITEAEIINDNFTDEKPVETNVSNSMVEEEVILPELPADIDFSHLVETQTPYWDVAAFNESGISNENWHTILVQNRFKIDLPITPLVSRDWQLIKKNKAIRILFRSAMDAKKDLLARKKEGKYSIQLISIEHNKFPLAVSLIRQLLKDGHYAYMHRTEAEFDGKFWYRVRVGFFKNIEDARAIGKEIHDKYKSDKWFAAKYWPVQPGPQELSRPILDLRQSLNKPWVIQLPLYTDKESALTDQGEFNIETEVSYLSQKLDSSGKIQYRLRIGFFETQKEANEKIFVLKKKISLFKKARLKHL